MHIYDPRTRPLSSDFGPTLWKLNDSRLKRSHGRADDGSDNHRRGRNFATQRFVVWRGTAIAGVSLASVMHADASALNAHETHKPEIPAPIHPEPNVNLAQLWWPAPRNVWTPVGWKDHLFRFHSVYNGTLLCVPTGWLIKPDTKEYEGRDIQLNFTVSADGSIPPIPGETTKLYKTDGGVGTQGWREDKETPVLWTEWPCQEGVVMRQELFSHLKGGRAVETGIEPLYAWLRLSVSFVHPIRPPHRFSFGIQLSKAYYDVTGNTRGFRIPRHRPGQACSYEATHRFPHRCTGRKATRAVNSAGEPRPAASYAWWRWGS